MARPKLHNLPDLSGYAVPGRSIPVRVTPGATRDRVIIDGEQIRISVTAPPENGKANHAVRKILAKCLGVAPSDLTLKRGETSRTKVFVYVP